MRESLHALETHWCSARGMLSTPQSHASAGLRDHDLRLSSLPSSSHPFNGIAGTEEKRMTDDGPGGKDDACLCADISKCTRLDDAKISPKQNYCTERTRVFVHSLVDRHSCFSPVDRVCTACEYQAKPHCWLRKKDNSFCMSYQHNKH